MSDALLDGEVLSEGRFRVDRKRALEKMEKFRLEDPRQYVIELLCAAVCAEAEAVHILNDSDDFDITWVGTAPTREELDGLFDWLWGTPKDRRTAMLQHMGIGVLGSLGLSPRWVHVDAVIDGGAVRLDVVDPAETRAEPIDAPELDGLRCHVREKPGTHALGELLTPWTPPAETRIVQRAACWFPIPVFVNGVRLAQAEPPSPAALTWQGQHGTRTGALWIVPPGIDAHVDLLRNGAVVAQVERRIGLFGVAGWFRDDALRLGASRARVVQDDAWKACSSALDEVLSALLRDGVKQALEHDGIDEMVTWRGTGDLAHKRYRATREELLLRLAQEGVAHLLEAEEKLGGLLDIPILEDLHGTAWTARRLRALSKPPGYTTQPDLADVSCPYVQFHARHLELLSAIRDDVANLTEVLDLRRQGRENRQRATARKRHDLALDVRHAQSFEDGAMRGVVGLNPRATNPSLDVAIRLGGIPLCSRTLPSPAGAMVAILDHPGLTPNMTFTDIREDAAWEAAKKKLLDEAHAHAIARILTDLAHPTSRGLAFRHLTRMLDNTGGKALAGKLERLDPRLSQAPSMLLGTFEQLPLTALLEGDNEWWLLEELPVGCPADVAAKVLLVPESLHRVWIRWLGKRAERDPEEIHQHVRRAARLSGPRKEPTLPRDVKVWVDIDEDGLTGKLGWRPEAGMLRRMWGQGSERDAVIEVLRDGYAVCHMEAGSAGLKGLVGAVDCPDVPTNIAHDEIAYVDSIDLIVRLLPHVARLAQKLWDKVPAGQPAPPYLMAWLAKHPDDAPPDRPVVYTHGGEPISLANLLARTQGKRRSADILQVLPKHPGGLPGFDDHVVNVPGLSGVLEAVCPGRWKDATQTLQKAVVAHREYLRRPPVSGYPPALASMVVEEDDWKGRFFLPANVAHIGLARVECRWGGRVLATRYSTRVLGCSLVVEGPAFVPDATFTNALDTKRLTHIKNRCAGQLHALVEQALDELDDQTLVATAPIWLALATRLRDDRNKHQHRRELSERVDRLPLLLRVDGKRASIAELFAAAAGKHKIWMLPIGFEQGPADHPWYLYSQTGVKEALEARLGRTLHDGGEALLTWRVGWKRKQAARKRKPVLPDTWPARTTLTGKGLEGEVGLGTVNSHVTDHKLVITPLVEGVALEEVKVAAPAPMAAVVTGEGVRADRSFSKVVENKRWGEIVDEIRADAETLAHRHVCEAEADRDWAMVWLLARQPDGPAADARVFPTLGEPVSLNALRARDDAGTVTFVRSPPPLRRFPVPPQPVVTTRWLEHALAQVFNLHEVADRLTPAPSYRWSVTPQVDVQAEGRRIRLAVADNAADEGVQLRVHGMVLVERYVFDTASLPLIGEIDDPGLRPSAGWNAVEDGPELDALRAVVEAHAAKLLQSFLALHARSGQHGLTLRTALMRTVPEAADLNAVAAGTAEGLAARLAALPLFPTSTGEHGSLTALLAQEDRVRAVPTQAGGRPAPGASPFWRLTQGERLWLGQVKKVVLATRQLLEEEEGNRRREGTRFPKRLRGLDVARRSEGFDAALWLEERHDDKGVAVLVGGVRVEWEAFGVPGLTGWVDGDFTTSVGFDRAHLPDDVVSWVHAQAAELLTREAVSGQRSRTIDRFNRMPPGKVEALMEGPWRDVPLFESVEGMGITLAEVREALKKGRVAYCVDQGEVVHDGLALRVGVSDLGALRRVAKSNKLLAVDPVWRAQQQEEKKAQRERARRFRKTALAVVGRAESFVGDGTDAMAALSEHEAWVDAVPNWVADHKRDSAHAALAAYVVASRVAGETGEIDAELSALAALADRLAEEL